MSVWMTAGIAMLAAALAAAETAAGVTAEKAGNGATVTAAEAKTAAGNGVTATAAEKAKAGAETKPAAEKAGNGVTAAVAETETKPAAAEAGNGVTETKPAAEKAKAGAAVAGKPAAAGRESVITADQIEFDNKEGVILFDRNVLVDDEQFSLRSDRLLVFLEGTNDVRQILAIGSVSITNGERSASCDKAVYTRSGGQIVMTGRARLRNGGRRGGEVQGDRITFWLDDERMEVSKGSRVVLPPGTFKKADRRLL